MERVKVGHDRIKNPGKPISRDRALEIFALLCGLGYAASVKHIKGNYYVEVPVRLQGDRAYMKEAEIMEIATRGGFTAVQAGNLLRIA